MASNSRKRRGHGYVAVVQRDPRNAKATLSTNKAQQRQSYISPLG